MNRPARLTIVSAILIAFGALMAAPPAPSPPPPLVSRLVRIGSDGYFEFDGARWVPYGANYLPPAIRADKKAKPGKPSKNSP